MLKIKTLPILLLSLLFTKAFATKHILYYVPPASNDMQEGFIRIVNPNANSILFSIDAIDDSGKWSATSLQNLSLAANSALQLNSNDIENGNSKKGFSSGFGKGIGNWRLVINSDNDMDVMSYIRTPDGFLNDMHDVVGGKPNQTSHRVPIFNPASNPDQKSTIRISNDVDAENKITIYGYDDSGKVAGTVSITLSSLAVVELTSEDIEKGNTSKGITGSLGNGAGKWRLEIFSSQNSTLINLLELPGGYISNLSGKSNDGKSNEVVVTPEATFYESKVKDTFNGWDGDTLVELDNGQIWQQSVYRYEYHYAYRPNAIVYKSSSVWKMLIEGTDQAVTVVQIK